MPSLGRGQAQELIAIPSCHNWADATQQETQLRTRSRFQFGAGATQRSGDQFIVAKFLAGPGAGAERNYSLPHLGWGRAPGTTARNNFSFPSWGRATQRSGEQFLVVKFDPGPRTGAESNSSLLHLGWGHTPRRTTNNKSPFPILSRATQRSGDQFVVAKFWAGPGAGAGSNYSLPH